jgi:hypothetical protein
MTMREHMEPLGVRTSIDIHLADEGRASYQVHPEQRRAVIALETSAANVALFVSAQNLHRIAGIIIDAQAALAAGSTGSTGSAGSQALAGKAA